uniref:Uncharacterized protein n=1 Tax=Salix viminalis TaxID=40686 RepID=A0A6N2M179_SALVM
MDKNCSPSDQFFFVRLGTTAPAMHFKLGGKANQIPKLAFEDRDQSSFAKIAQGLSKTLCFGTPMLILEIARNVRVHGNTLWQNNFP